LSNLGKMQTWVRAAFCAVLAFAQILAFAHGASVGHRTCLEHGEPIHAGAHSPAPISSPPTESMATLSPTSGAETHAHEHCLSVAFGRAKLIFSSPEAELVERHPALAAWAEHLDAASPGVDLLALAPKGSPPRG
jgi:hypothetical protein